MSNVFIHHPYDKTSCLTIYLSGIDIPKPFPLEFSPLVGVRNMEDREMARPAMNSFLANLELKIPKWGT